MLDEIAEREVAAATKAEYDELVMRVASWCMRQVARDEYTPMSQVLAQFVDDVKQASA